MDPTNPESFNHRTELLSTGKRYHFVDQIPESYNPETTPTLLCIHGFPDLWYAWRFAIVPWVNKCGWRVVVPDMLGYGGTDKPEKLEEYSFKSLCADMSALLDLIGVKRAVIIGHDWGSFMSWRFALWYPKKTLALITLSVPFDPPKTKHLPLQEVVERLPNLKYQLYFNDPSSTQDANENIPNFLAGLHRFQVATNPTQSTDPKTRFIQTEHPISESYMTPTEFDYYVKNFTQGGMNGPLNYYRTRDINFKEEFEAKLSSYIPASIPILFIYGDKDRTCARSSVERSLEYAPQMRVFELFDVGHWIPVQASETLSAAVAEFVRTTLRNSTEAKL
ncbi:hypothetical protein Clacol_001381 [Clathrus columnatus]|uniref:AB hydrolase-1 domain-containing protein n=1 Tax=Clathrus columnatus TaxID=1419009 RepID=A0AAV5A2D6_9AGAM|nr:hypothetical protein Clacol_001381 [Clathrus columnatus]